MLITSRENPLIKEAAALVRDKKVRKQTGLFVAEGARACFEAVKSSAEVLRGFVTEAIFGVHRAPYFRRRRSLLYQRKRRGKNQRNEISPRGICGMPRRRKSAGF